eukprot:Skav201351  [mRNA]  locus=scaffold2643:69267:73622:+ [translate_table: standard]
MDWARRSADSSYQPSLARLKSRLVEAVLEDRPPTIVVMGPSTTFGRGCPLQHLRWSDVLQNLSNFTGSPLPLRVINEARPATPLHTQWRSILGSYQHDPKVDLIVLDYAVTSTDKSQSHKSAVMIHTFLQSWRRPPAILFVETFSVSDMTLLAEGLEAPTAELSGHCMPSACAKQNFRDRVFKRNMQGTARLLQDSCRAPEQEHCTGSISKDVCAAGFKLTLEESKQNADSDVVLNFSAAEICEMNIESDLAFDGSSFPALVGNSSKWHLGADRPGKFGWIANEEPAIQAPKGSVPAKHAEIPNTDIVFPLRLSAGTVFLDHLASYENIGSATCQLENLKGELLGPAVKIDALWSNRYSIGNRVTLSASKKRELPKAGPNAAVRLTSNRIDDRVFSTGGAMAQTVDPVVDVLEEGKHPLDSLFRPKRVAVVGATDKEGSVGRTLLKNLISNPFGGVVYPVNPKREHVLGILAFRNIAACPGHVDLVIVVTPASTVPGVIQDCVDQGVKNAIIISAGFKEVGPEGEKLEQEVERIAKKGNLRIVGPNCLGIICPTSGLNASFANLMPQKGSVAFISQSGAMITSVLDWSVSQKVGFSAVISIGSMLDMDFSSMIFYLAKDPATKSIVLYMESIGNARNFLSAARECSLTKPIIVIKGGRTDAAAKAAASHTGSLTGSDAVLDAAFKRAGVLRVDSMSDSESADLFEMADVLSKQPLPNGNRLAILTNAGGPGVLATDALASHGGVVAELSTETVQRLNGVLPAAWSHGNPIDVLGDATAKHYADSLEVVAKEAAEAAAAAVHGLGTAVIPQESKR